MCQCVCTSLTAALIYTTVRLCISIRPWGHVIDGYDADAYYYTLFKKKKNLILCYIIPFGKFGPPYLGKATAAARTALCPVLHVHHVLGFFVFP